MAWATMESAFPESGTILGLSGTQVEEFKPRPCRSDPPQRNAKKRARRRPPPRNLAGPLDQRNFTYARLEVRLSKLNSHVVIPYFLLLFVTDTVTRRSTRKINTQFQAQAYKLIMTSLQLATRRCVEAVQLIAGPPIEQLKLLVLAS